MGIVLRVNAWSYLIFTQTYEIGTIIIIPVLGKTQYQRS